MKKKLTIKIFILSAFVILISCGRNNNYYPKPRGFFRIDLPKKEYKNFDSTSFPFAFSMPVYSYIQPVENDEANTLWFNLNFPKLNGNINFSYRPLNRNLYELSEDAREFANKHIAKANEILQIKISNEDKKVYGIIYDIEGTSSASPYQFFLTDSTNHFLRGAVYFNHVPNNDSIAPIISRVKEDIDTIISTFRWK